MEKQNGQASADKVVAGLQRDFKIVGTHRVHSWYAWGIIGIVFGMALGVIYIANQTTGFVSTQAATVVTKSYFVNSNSFNIRDLPLTGGGIEVAPIGTMPGIAGDYETLQIKKPSDAYKNAVLTTDFGKPSQQPRAEFLTVMRLADKKALKPDQFPAGGGFSFKAPIGIPADIAATITRSQIAFTSTENVSVFVNGVAQGRTYERSKGAAAEVRTISLPQGTLKEGANVVEFQVVRPEKAVREFVISFSVGLTATADISSSLSGAKYYSVATIQPSQLNEWVKRESAAGRFPRTGMFHAAKSGARIIERYFLTAGATPLAIEGFIFQKKNVPVKKAGLGVSYADSTSYGGSFPGLSVSQGLETDPRLSTMTIDSVSAAIIDPISGQRTPLSGSYSVTNMEEKALAFTLPSPVTVQPLSTILLEFYGDPRTPLTDEDLRDPGFRYALILQEPFRFTEIDVAGGPNIAVKNNIDTRAANPLPGIHASFSVARNNFFDQVVAYISRPLSTPYYARKAGETAAVPVYELGQRYGLGSLGLLPEVFVFGYDVQTEEGGPRLTDFVYRGIRGVETQPGKLVFDIKSGTPTINAYDPHYNRVIAKAVPGTKAGAKATYRFRFLPDEAVFRLRTEVLGPDASSENAKYVIDANVVDRAQSLEGIRPIVVSNPK